MKSISRFILFITGWKISGLIPPEIRKCVVMVAPHTSNMDFIIGRLGFNILGIRTRFLIKKELFFFPLGIILKGLGALPVDRKSATTVVDQVIGLFNRYDSLYFTITPEGTRKYNAHWKKGYYYIALRAKVPLALGFLDYGEKCGGVGKIIIPSGNYEADFKIIEEFYRGKKARYPKQYNLS
jgi:1-acyl-sn-glycerol-3-phosphate acyltransferase